MTGFQLSEWEAYDKIDPIGKWRDDFRTAKLESLLVNIVNQLYHKQGVEPTIVTPVDFMVKWGEDMKEPEPEIQSLEDMKKALMAIADTHKTRGKEDGKPLVKKTKKT